MSLPRIPTLTASDLTALRLKLLDAVEDLMGAATCLREGQEVLENGETAASHAQSCCEEAADAINDAHTKLRAITLKCEELAS